MSRPTDPSEKDLLEFLDGHKPIGKQNPDHVCFDAIRRLIEEHGKWKEEANRIVQTYDLELRRLQSDRLVISKIRDFDFGKEGEDAR